MCEKLKYVDFEELRGDIAHQIKAGYHMVFFKDRLNVWAYIKDTNATALDALLTTVLTDFMTMYRQHSTGKDKYTRLLLTWYTYMNKYIVLGGETGDAG